MFNAERTLLFLGCHGNIGCMNTWMGEVIVAPIEVYVDNVVIRIKFNVKVFGIVSGNYSIRLNSYNVLVTRVQCVKDS
jgi:hypothetical protein